MTEEQTAEQQTRHISVLKTEVLEFLLKDRPEGPFLVLDGTLGGAGHAEALLEAEKDIVLLACDRDAAAIQRASQRLARFKERVVLVNANYSQFEQLLESPLGDSLTASQREVLLKAGYPQFSAMLLDLGMSSDQLDSAERGFSFNQDAPLDMRMDRAQVKTAELVLNEYSQRDLMMALIRGGVNPRDSRFVAAAIIKRRPLKTTGELAQICQENIRSKKSDRFAARKKNPATTVFQAIRIEVNDEFAHIREFLQKAPANLKPSANLCIISFHSLEDKLVTQAMRSWSRSSAWHPLEEILPLGKLLTKQAIIPQEEELALNPRARSARLRVFKKGIH